MNINYRKPTLEDKESLAELGILLNEFNNEIEDKPEEFIWPGWKEDILEETIEDISEPSNIIYLAEDENKVPAGYILAKTCDCCGSFSIDQLYVKEDFRGHKIGKKLLDLAIAEQKGKSDEVSLEVYQSNPNGIEFYKKYGFNEDGLVMRFKL